MERKVKVFENGLRLVLEKNMKNVIAVNILFAVGSKDEDKNEEGYSHFIEHMTFKSTKNMTAEEIMDKLTFFGADYNAYTSRNTTRYVFKCLPENFEECFKIYADMLLNFRYNEEEFRKEREVIIEEMKRCDDDPVSVMYKRSMENYYDGLSFAHDELGTEETLFAATTDDLIRFKTKFYRASNCIITVAGNIEFDKVTEVVEKYYSYAFNYNSLYAKVDCTPFDINIKKKYDIVERDDNQVNVCINIKSVTNTSDKRVVSNLYTWILGDKLFKNIREKMGLVYSIGAYSETGINSGTLSIMFGAREKNIKVIMQEIKFQIATYAKNGVTAEELQRAKNIKKSGIAFASEKNSSIAETHGTYMLILNTLCDEEKLENEVNEVSLEQINDFAKIIHGEKTYCVVAVGKNIKISDLKQF